MTNTIDSSNTSYLVIGGEGFLGHNLISELVKSYPNSSITSLDLIQRYFTSTSIELTNQSSNEEKFMKHSFIKSDLTSLNELIDCFNQIKPEIVFHTASPWIGSGKEICEKVNILGTQNVIEACKKVNVKKLVYTSSAGVVYNGEDLINVDERLPIPETALDHYNITKVGIEIHILNHIVGSAKAEAIVLKANDNDKLLTCALRPAGIFGPGDRQAIPGIIQVLKNGQHRIQIGSNDNLFDWTYVDNVVHAHLLAATKLGESVPLSAFSTYLKPICKSNPRRSIPTSRTITTEDDVELLEFSSSSAKSEGSPQEPNASWISDLKGELDTPLPAKRTKWDQWANVSTSFMYPEGIVPVAGEVFFITGGEPVYFWDFTRSVWKTYASSKYVNQAYEPIPSFVWRIPKFLGVLLAMLAELWCKVLQKPSGFTTSSVRYACATRFYNIEKARVVLGYEPPVGVAEGISRAVEWYAKNEASQLEKK
ncbi:3-beta hydroxysteroid dehydrogenase/isomerase family-domain-containing protein [Melampsora americana]|nr:3-beta hydroxysteroid dehydrogenase/isomerase family-domain-containing protein [Melampsora americana]